MVANNYIEAFFGCESPTGIIANYKECACMNISSRLELICIVFIIITFLICLYIIINKVKR